MTWSQATAEGDSRPLARPTGTSVERPRIVPVIGARTRAQLTESLGALEVKLTEEELRQIEEAVPASEVVGTRYDERQMRMLDSERK